MMANTVRSDEIIRPTAVWAASSEASVPTSKVTTDGSRSDTALRTAPASAAGSPVVRTRRSKAPGVTCSNAK